MVHLAAFAALFAAAISPALADVPNLGSPMPNQNFPDVNIQWDSGKWYAFATKSNGANTPNVPVAVSDDYKTWNIVKDANGKPFDALPVLPKWARTDDKLRVWDPDVVKLDDGTFVMYVALAIGTGSKHCIGVATSKNIRGPYKTVPKFDKDPWICPDLSNGAFGVSGFKNWDVKGDWGLPDGDTVRRDNCGKKVNGKCGNSYVDDNWSEGGYGGKRYVVYKIQNADQSKGVNTKTPLTIQEVNAKDGYTQIGGPTRLMDNDGAADAHSIEGPTIYKTPKGKFVFFFARGNTALSKYATGYATSDKLMGPYTRKGDILKTGTPAGLISPGAMDVSWNGVRNTFHAIPKLPYQQLRVMHAGVLSIDDTTGKVTVVSV